ncbi:SRPBCC family protein [Aureivirga marina]|uniref:hypothetical protein n=1 Tax=Aureivirga marina TaxID=1182451 RepID=UPI0018C8F0BE|nr:hypothetical protein [Aureivirga marina]
MKKIFCIVFCILALNVEAQTGMLHSFTDLKQFTELASKSKWEVAKKRKGITLKYRKLKFSDTLEVREMKAEFFVDGTLSKIYENLKNPKQILEWNVNMKEVKVLKSSDSVWVSHYVYKIPHPFSQQDLVAEYDAKMVDDNLIITSYAKPKYIPSLEDVKREKFYLSKWEVIPMNSDQFMVEFSVVSISNSKIPRFIKDPIIQKKLINSFVNLQNLLKS